MHQNQNRLGFAPDPTVGAHNAPPVLLVRWGGGDPLLISTRSTLKAPRPSRLRRSICVQLKIFLILIPG